MTKKKNNKGEYKWSIMTDNLAQQYLCAETVTQSPTLSLTYILHLKDPFQVFQLSDRETDRLTD